jgi:hypothetical protein
VLHFLEPFVDSLHRGQGTLDGYAVRREADAVRIGQLLELRGDRRLVASDLQIVLGK